MAADDGASEGGEEPSAAAPSDPEPDPAPDPEPDPALEPDPDPDPAPAGPAAQAPPGGAGPAPVPPAPPAGEKVTFWAIVTDPPVRVATVGVFVAMLGFGMVYPILPLFAHSFGVGLDAVGLLISGFSFTRLLFDLFAGPIVDRMGERAASAVGVVVVGVSSALMAASPSFTLAVIFRAAGGAGSAVLFAALYSYLLKVVPKDRMARSLSVFFGSFNVASIAGAPIGGVLAHLFGLTAPLWAYGVMCGISGWVLYRSVRNPGRAPGAEVVSLDLRRAIRIGRRLLRSRAFVVVCVLNLGFWIQSGAENTLTPLFANQSLHMGFVGISVVFTLFAVTEFLLLYPSGWASDRYGRKPVLLPGILGLAVLTVAVPFAVSPLWLAVLFAAGGLFSGVAGAAPSAMLSDVTPADASATGVGVYRFFGDFGGVVGPLLAGASAAALGYRWAFLIGVLPLFLAFALLVPVPETMGTRKPGREEGVGP